MEHIDITGIRSDKLSDGLEPVKHRRFLWEKRIAISVSQNEDLFNLGFTDQHLNDISIELARGIIANDGTAVYGGDQRSGGFTNLFSELSSHYKKINDDRIGFVNYFVFPNTKSLTRETRIHFLSKQVEIKEIEPPESIDIDVSLNYEPYTNVEHRYLFAECFREMRLQMAKDSDARILVGGKTSNFLGYIPGVIEEALLTLIENKPVFLVGGFGGATAKLISILKGEEVHELSNNYQYANEFLKKYQNFVKDKCNYTDYENLKSELLPYNIDALSKLNGLTVYENEILFTSKNIHEVVFYIMKGLKKL